MKLFISSFLVVVSALTSSSHANAFEQLAADGRDLQASCPVPSPDIACTMESAPVKCGWNACEYGNQCAASAAGFAPSSCYPATCAGTSEETVACTMESDPVQCGVDRCDFANYCLAEAAGFPRTTCLAQNCPVPPEGTICSLEYDPFVCFDAGSRLCLYDNGCLASTSGFSPELTGSALECVRVADVTANQPTCPVVPEGTACTLEYNPLRCSKEGAENCVYGNHCEAQAAGFDPTDPTMCQSANCALPDPSTSATPCTADFNPVHCFPEGCQYSNLCTAQAAGYSEAMCIPATCPLPDPLVQCTFEYNPQVCDGSCQYDNPCIATSAGATNCVSLEDPVNPETCPVSDATVSCTIEFDEKVCGENDCFYSNLCLAEAAGWSNLDCRNPNCPSPYLESGACLDFGIDNVVCGPYACPYPSSCLANRARFLPSECSSVDCPTGPPDTLCTLEYDPLICSSSSVDPSLVCSYSNPCLAQAAGYNPDPTAGHCISPLVITNPTRSVVPFQPVNNGTTTIADGGPETLESSSAVRMSSIVGLVVGWILVVVATVSS